MGLPKCHLQNDQHADDDDDNDDDDEIAPDVSLVPPVKCLESDNSGGSPQMPGTMFLHWGHSKNVMLSLPACFSCLHHN